MPIEIPNNPARPATFLSPTTSTEYLAVSTDESEFQTFSYETLAQCQAVLGLHVCPRNNVIKKLTEDECLLSLYQNEWRKIKSQCPWKRSLKDEATQINDTTFMIFCTPTQTRQSSSSVPDQANRK